MKTAGRGTLISVFALIFISSSLTYAVSVVKCDLVKDYNIDARDLKVIAGHWLDTCGDCNGADLDNSGNVNLADFTLFAPHWQTEPNLVYAWSFIEQQWTNTMYDLTHDPAYSTPDHNYPRSIIPETGKWKPYGLGWSVPLQRWTYVHWAGGYIPGSLWYLYQRTSDETWKNWAQSWTNRLEYERTRTKDHEAGFIVPRSFGLGYKLTGNPFYKQQMFDATKSIMRRYNPTIGCIKSWNDLGKGEFTVIIDGMMMLDMVFWASKNGGDPNYPQWYNIAVSHANKTMQNNVRPNGSVWQAVDYNEVTGAVDLKWNKQGYNNNTTWSRGQAWGIEGFTIAYRETLDPNYLTTAKKIANYFIDHLPPDYVPYWDFNIPEYPAAPQIRDTSAAAIAASGLLDLITFLPDADPNKQKFKNAAVHILDSLISPAYLANDTNSMGLLLHGTGNCTKYPDLDGGEIDRSLMYGDHFFIEALMRYEDLFH